MNKSAVFRLTLSFPNVSGLALHQWNYQFIETVARLSDLYSRQIQYNGKGLPFSLLQIETAVFQIISQS